MCDKVRELSELWRLKGIGNPTRTQAVPHAVQGSWEIDLEALVCAGKGLGGTVGVHTYAEGKAEGQVEGKLLEQRPQLVSQGQMALSWVALQSCPH